MQIGVVALESHAIVSALFEKFCTELFLRVERVAGQHRTFEVKLLSTVCAGDSSLAAFLSVWHDAPECVEDALRLSMATGANVVECPGLGDFAKVDEYKKHIDVRQVC